MMPIFLEIKLAEEAGKFNILMVNVSKVIAIKQVAVDKFDVIFNDYSICKAEGLASTFIQEINQLLEI